MSMRQVEAAMECIDLALRCVRPNEDSPFSNTGARFECDTFQVHAYSWSDDEQPWNFKYKDFEASWYKYSCRNLETNRFVSDAEVVEMICDCLAAILNLSK